MWNIVQSHPKIIDTYYELNEIFGKKCNIGLIEKLKIEINSLSSRHVFELDRMVTNKLRSFANHSFHEDEFNKMRTIDEEYENDEFEKLAMVTKLVSSWESDPLRKLLKRNDALKYLPLLTKSFKDHKVIFLVRNGLAMAEGWGRRGATIANSAKWYRYYIKTYENLVNSMPGRAKIFRFEDLLYDPFKCADEIFDFIGCNRIANERLRIAIKPTVKSHQNVINTTKKNKVWIDKKNLRDYLEEDINSAQIERLSFSDRDVFLELNSDILTKYRYL